MNKRIQTKRPNSKKAAERRAASKEREKHKFLARQVLVFGKLPAKAALIYLRHRSVNELLDLRVIAETLLISAAGRRRQFIAKALLQIKNAEKLHDALGMVKSDRYESKSLGALNRKLTARMAENHPRGELIGKTKIVEFKSPGCTVWATPRKRK